ncbi:pyroglutamyl-peptidase I [Anaerosphaera multitolerans]|uniref:Pyrrolidone-carboxylate peptidase n=1 Tax=Anaerosphaera multitolerans TaxID=2487351 RepID=A0A437S672_9FIRM|nr:pyroglutamyl-peptidase I [Anaerosphaera multitolerans]RVU54511.1 pyroglutamyl-peptidase I [Anaerosphaera multitolerans]
MNLLIVGFEALNPDKTNLGYNVVKQLSDKIFEHNLIKLELPSSFDNSIDILEKAMDTFNPKIVLCINQLESKSGLSLERIAINIDDAQIPDNNGITPVDKKIYSKGENAYFTKLPIKKILKNLKSIQIPATISNSAGTHFSNHVMYGLLYLIENNKKFENTIGGLIHIPISKDENGNISSLLAMDDIVKALKIIIETVIKEPFEKKESKKKNYFFDFNI